MSVAIESLSQNDQFVDVAIEATYIALKTSAQEKREALKNAVLNTALPNPPEESLQNMFLSFIESLTVLHLRLLELFNNPEEYIAKHNGQFGNISMGSMSQLIESVFPELKGRRDLYDLIWKDLFSKALVTINGLHTMMTANGVMTKRTTHIGELFLKFIKDPVEK